MTSPSNQLGRIGENQLFMIPKQIPNERDKTV